MPTYIRRQERDISVSVYRAVIGLGVSETLFEFAVTLAVVVVGRRRIGSRRRRTVVGGLGLMGLATVKMTRFSRTYFVSSKACQLNLPHLNT